MADIKIVDQRLGKVVGSLDELLPAVKSELWTTTEKMLDKVNDEIIPAVNASTNTLDEANLDGLVYREGDGHLDVFNADDAPQQIWLRTDNVNRRVVGRDTDESVQSQLILANDKIQLGGPTLSGSELYFTCTSSVPLLVNGPIQDDRGYVRCFVTSHTFNTSSSLVYMPMVAGSVADSASFNDEVRAWHPGAGRLVRAVMSVSNNCGNTIMGFHLNDNGTATSTVTINQSTADTGVEYDFSGKTASWAAGQSVSISLDTQTVPDDCRVWFEWEFTS